MGANDKVEATFHPQTKVPTAEENPVIMAIEALERLTQQANDTVESDSFDVVQEDYNLVREQLDRLQRLLNFNWRGILGPLGHVVVEEISNG